MSERERMGLLNRKAAQYTPVRKSLPDDLSPSEAARLKEHIRLRPQLHEEARALLRRMDNGSLTLSDVAILAESLSPRR